MADIVIRGIEMPKNEPLTITITPEGKVFRAFIPGSYGEVISLPEGHGRCIDAEDFLKRLDEHSELVYGCKTDADSVVIAQSRSKLTETEKSILEGLYEAREIMEDRVDTILEAEGGGEDG